MTQPGEHPRYLKKLRDIHEAVAAHFKDDVWMAGDVINVKVHRGAWLERDGDAHGCSSEAITAPRLKHESEAE